MITEKMLLITNKKIKVFDRKFIQIKKFSCEQKITKIINKKGYGLIVLLLDSRQYKQIVINSLVGVGCPVVYIAKNPTFKRNQRFVWYDQNLCRGNIIENTIRMFRWFVLHEGQPYRCLILLQSFCRQFYFYDKIQKQKELVSLLKRRKNE